MDLYLFFIYFVKYCNYPSSSCNACNSNGVLFLVDINNHDLFSKCLQTSCNLCIDFHFDVYNCFCSHSHLLASSY